MLVDVDQRDQAREDLSHAGFGIVPMLLGREASLHQAAVSLAGSMPTKVHECNKCHCQAFDYKLESKGYDADGKLPCAKLYPRHP